MKKILKIYGGAFILLISLQSCNPDDKYYSLNDEAKAFLVFDLNETFKLKKTDTDEIITLTVISKEVKFIGDGPHASGFISFGPTADIFVEKGMYSFTDNSNCYNGEVLVIAKKDGGYVLKAHLDDCFSNSNYHYYEFYDEFFSTVDVDGIEYPNAYLLRSYPNNLYYSKEKGILKIINEYNTLFNYVE